MNLLDALERLEVGDREIHAFLPEEHRRQRVLADADSAAKRSDGADPPDLFGVLAGVKDIMNVDGLPTRAGSGLPAALFEGPEATIVRRLRDAGALIAGKTTTTEFAFSDPSRTRNPRDLAHTPGGSSSGSAAAVAAGLVPVALGTQTVDSIVTPAAFCGVVGFKPTFARIPLDGIVSFSRSMDHAGFFTNTVSMAQVAASVLCDDWDDDPPASGLVLGIPAADYSRKAHVHAIEAVDNVVQLLGRQGVEVVETSALGNIDEIAVAHRRLIAKEFSRVHADWFSRYGDRYRPRSTGLHAEGLALPDSVVAEGRESGRMLRQSLEDVMEHEGITAFASPSTTDVAPPGLDFMGDPVMGMAWTHAHLPVVTLPIFPSPGGLPFGIQLTGRFGRDEELLNLARRVESAIG